MILIGVLIAILPAIDLFMSLISQSPGFIWKVVPYYDHIHLRMHGIPSAKPVVAGQFVIFALVMVTAVMARNQPKKRNWKRLIIPAMIAVIVPILLSMVYLDTGYWPTGLKHRDAQLECYVQSGITAVAMLLVILGQSPEQNDSDQAVPNREEDDSDTHAVYTMENDDDAMSSEEWDNGEWANGEWESGEWDSEDDPESDPDPELEAALEIMPPKRHTPAAGTRKYGGIGRIGYWVSSFFLLMLNVVFMASGEPGIALLGMLLVIFLSFALVASRLHNVGMSGMYALLILVPFANIYVGFLCAVCPAGYHDTKKLDTAGQMMVGIFLSLLAIFFIAVILAIIDSG